MKKGLFILGGVLLLFLLAFYVWVYPQFIIVSGFTAKNMCSNVFISGIDKRVIKKKDFGFGPLGMASIEVDYEHKLVHSSVFGFQRKTAIYRDHLGCALANRIDVEDVYHFEGEWIRETYDSLENWYDFIDTVELLSDSKAFLLKDAVNEAFTELNADEPKINSRAVVVLYKGQLVAEQYAEGFDVNSRLLGWSMTKSVMSTYIGTMVAEGRINIDSPVGVSSWVEDDRSKITWRQLLHMNSGLSWDENYGDVSDAVLMLFDSDNVGLKAEKSILESEPNTFWEYSSGSTNILSYELKKLFSSNEGYIRFPYLSIFDRIGMYSMILEADATGGFIGSSFSYATARDWAKLGQLYLQEGLWAGERVLSKDWVQFVQEPAPNSSGNYGGHFWLNKGGALPDIPSDAYWMDGFQGQWVIIIPSKNIVIVRLGLTYNRNDFDLNQWVSNILSYVD